MEHILVIIAVGGLDSKILRLRFAFSTWLNLGVHLLHNFLWEGQVPDVNRPPKVQLMLPVYLVKQKQQAKTHTKFVREIPFRPYFVLRKGQKCEHMTSAVIRLLFCHELSQLMITQEILLVKYLLPLILRFLGFHTVFLIFLIATLGISCVLGTEVTRQTVFFIITVVD